MDFRAFKIRPRRGLAAACLLLMAPASAFAGGIDLDGRLVEPEWAAARVFNDFRVTDPLTQESPPFPTEVRVLPRREGLYVGVTVRAPRSQRTYGRSPRDADPMDADSVRVFVDFEGKGRTAYEFTVSLSNSERDGIVLNQTQQIYDWDSTWLHEVSEDDAAWYAEVLIPWSAAPMSESQAESRTIGIWFQTFNRKLAQGVSYPPMSTGRPTFVQDMMKIDVPRFPTASLNVAPYVSVDRDFVRDATRARAGADIFWKPNAENQFAATINPEFGQVEADDFVANFTPIETFFTEKRPFFTEGQSLFDVRTLQNGRLVYTRRIGNAPDAGSEDRSDIIGAAKYTGLAGALEYGGFAAVENDSSEAQGRKFFVGRTRYKTSTLSLGYLGTYTDRPTLARNAAVHALDFEWLPLQALSFNGQIIGTSVRQDSVAGGKRVNGFGTTVQASYAPGGIWEQYLRLVWLDRNYDINDLGYMERNSLHQIEAITLLYKRLYPDSSPIYASNWYLQARYRENDRREHLASHGEIAYFWQFRHFGSVFAYVGAYQSGTEDLVAPALGPIEYPTQRNVGFYWKDDQRASFHNYLQVDYLQEGIHDWAWEIALKPSYFFSPDLNVTVEADYLQSPDWLVYRYDTNVLGRYSRRQLLSAIKLNWYPARKQELRLKLQWLGTRARARSAYGLGQGKQIVPDPATPLTDFSVSSLGFQVRYRFELAPLSDLYLVYSRGGADGRDDEEQSFGQQLRSTLSQRTGERFFVKIAYRF
jgi:hypothetical protein